MRRRQNWILGSLVLTLVAACTEPTFDGELVISGVAAPVRIVRDELGMPAIYANSFEDGLVGQGFAMAQDRMFQLELIRHLAAGRLAEVAGASALNQDRLFRTVGMRQIAESVASRLRPRARRTFEAFSRGVNAYLESDRASLPAEYSLLGLDPEPWTLIDTLEVFVFINWNFSANLGEEVLSQRLIDRLGPDRAAELFPAASDLGAGLTYHPAHRAQGVAAADVIPPMRTGLGDDPFLTMFSRPVTDWRLGGSNAWVVGSTRSTSGAPMLASDPHGSGTMIPVPFYPQTIILPDIRMTGIAVVGLPGILTGRNSFMAWGFTNNNGDQQDLFIETIHPQNPELYLEHGQYVPFATRTERILIRGGNGSMSEESLTVRETPRGPIVTGLVPGVTEALSFRWYVKDLLDGELGLDEMALARTPDEFLTALAKWPSTTQNAHIAHRDGWIGWHIMGHVPIRVGHSGLFPIPADRAAGVWDGHSTIPFDAMPHFHAPKSDWTGSANHWGYGPDYPYVIATSNGGPYRALRIRERIEGFSKMSEADHRSVQLDTVSVLARRMLPAILADLEGSTDPDVREIGNRLAAWDGRVDTTSVGAALWNALYRNLVTETFLDELGADLTSAYLGQAYYFQERFEELMKDPNSAWFDDGATSARETRRDVVRKAAGSAVAELRESVGGDPETWQWGGIHSIFFENPIGTTEPLRSQLGAGPFPFSGDGETLDRGAYSLTGSYDVQINAAMRMVADLGDDCSVLGSITTGVSGRLESPHYDDQVQAYVSGEGSRWWLCDDQIEAHKEHELMLQPAPREVPATQDGSVGWWVLLLGLAWMALWRRSRSQADTGFPA